MTNHRIGIWLDHKQACLVTLLDQQHQVEWLTSEVEPHIKSTGRPMVSGGMHSHEATTSDSKLTHRRQNEMHQYFKLLINKVGEVQAWYLIGPANTKDELKKELLKQKKLDERSITVETCDQMTEGQIVAKVREFFHDAPRR